MTPDFSIGGKIMNFEAKRVRPPLRAACENCGDKGSLFACKAWKFVTLILLLLLSCPLSSRGADSFSIPDGLEDEVRFWRSIFGAYGDNQVLFHDEKFLNAVYEVIDFSGLEARRNLGDSAKQKIRETEVNRTKKRIAATLKHLAADRPHADQTDEERYYWKLFKGDKEELKEAAGRIRVQPGQRDRLARAIAKSAPWMGDIEAIFSDAGIPKELTALMFVESMFNPRAVSDVGASGLWQFMPETGRSYVSINNFWDDRNDALKASFGAARFLKDLYTKTGDWALAVNAYHSGLGRILKAVETLGTKEIASVIHHFDDPGYGFYSRNYVPEFLAVVYLYRNRDEYFGAGSVADDRQYDIVKTSDFVILPEIAGRFGISLAALRKLNTALKDEVLSGELPLPPHYPLKVPKGTGYPLAVAVGSLSSRNQ